MFLPRPKKNKQIPQGMVWLEGDNPFNSTDSRSYGPVPLALVKGLVSFKVSDPSPRNCLPLYVQSADPRSTITIIYICTAVPLP